LSSRVSGLRDEEAVEGFSETQNLLDKYLFRVQPGQIQKLIEAGRAKGLALDGLLGFVEDKLIQKRDQNDPVFSAKLLINAISDDADLHRWGVKRHRVVPFSNKHPLVENCLSVLQTLGLTCPTVLNSYEPSPDTTRSRRRSIFSRLL